MRKPPALAIWLSDRLGVTERNGPLAGDLLEAFQGGRSAGWFWRQALIAIADSVLHSHRVRFLGGILTGWGALAALYLMGWLAGPFRFHLYAGPAWIHWPFALLFLAISKRFERSHVAATTFFFCLGIDLAIPSRFWTQPVSFDYVCFSGLSTLGLALIFNLKTLLYPRRVEPGFASNRPTLFQARSHRNLL